MNREIKFRAWGIDRGRMHDVHNIAFHESYGYKAITSEQPLDLHSTFTKKEEFILMQYTGLKDKNGVDIYEGDIVHLTSDEGVNYNALIIFKDGGFCAIDGTESDYGFRRYDLSRFDLYLEVIGNIYENTELLEVES